MKPDYTYKAHIDSIVDGDTVDATVDVGFKMTAKLRLRLLGVNTAELHSPDPNERKKAADAKLYAAITLLDQDVIIKTQKTDVFGRYLATVYFQVGENWISFNDDLLVKGLAVPFKG